jgi:ComF family protein
MLQILQRCTYDLSGLFYPELCEACDELLIPGEKILCTGCMISLPHTGFHQINDNPVARQFWGKIPLYSASAFWHFHKGGKVQRLLHRLKYEHKPEIGVRTGELYGQDLKVAADFRTVDLILPVPLHPEKLKIRGYNQAASFAEGLARSMQVETRNDVLLRQRHTETQTRKSRFARFLNVGKAFHVPDLNQLVNRHVLLVDDVITTGSTLEACALKLLDAANVKVSVASMAYADR